MADAERHGDSTAERLGGSTALLTDRYELTMLDAALRSDMAERRTTFEVFCRSLAGARTYGVFAGVDRLLDAIERFRFGPDELRWLEAEGIVSPTTIDWLASYRFRGSIDAYAEGELYTAGSPVLTVEGTFGEAVLLETLVLSILNHDSAIAGAAARIVVAAHGRPLIEMGTRRVSPEAGVAAARAAWLAGFESTSNLEAGRRYGIPTAGTAAHAFVLAYPSEAEAFAAQVDAGGAGTTLLVDTYDVAAGIRTAVDVAGPSLGAVRIDSGDLAAEAWAARRLLDRLGAAKTRIVVTGDLDDVSIAELAEAPIDGYGVGTRVVTGLGQPTAGFVYKLVAVSGPVSRSEGRSSPAGAAQHPVAKHSPGKATVGGRKWAWRVALAAVPDAYEGPSVGPAGPVLADVIRTTASPQATGGRPLQGRVVEAGKVLGRPSLAAARERCGAGLAELADHVGLIAVRPPG